MHQNTPELLVFFCLFSNIRMLFFRLLFILYVLQLSGRNGFMPKFRKELMTEFQGNTQKDEGMKGQADPIS